MKRIFATLTHKWPEYLLEILVLTIGVYGAFALNNWNDWRKQQIEAQVLYQQLQLDFQANLDQLNQKIAFHRIAVDEGFSILKAIDEQEADYDSLMLHLSVVGIDVTFDPIKSDLSSSGKINLITNQELNRLVSNWDSDLAALREIEIMWQERAYGQFLDIMIDLGIERDIKTAFWNRGDIHEDWLLDKRVTENKVMTNSKTPQDLEKILKSKALEGIVAHSVVMNEAAIEQSLALKARIERTLELLNQELNK